ncbi:hypothetical protein T03_10991 [Trichinella britovi]|uniref:Uncharacterized protein n=1 Tax=Trichinella britovi TaxID=45882 RepID=A0A0V1CLZ3_TRIBR|nr:hypothetical protein T03_10991 [Trichinella britovi]
MIGCSGRNNTDPVGVTRPRGGSRKSRVGKNNTRAPPARSLSEHLAAPSRVELGSVDEPSRSATEGRSSEGLVRTLEEGIRTTARDNGSRSDIRTLRACSRNV